MSIDKLLCETLAVFIATKRSHSEHTEIFIFAPLVSALLNHDIISFMCEHFASQRLEFGVAPTGWINIKTYDNIREPLAIVFNFVSIYVGHSVTNPPVHPQTLTIRQINNLSAHSTGFPAISCANAMRYTQRNKNKPLVDMTSQVNNMLHPMLHPLTSRIIALVRQLSH
jgi:hypothetical protein